MTHKFISQQNTATSLIEKFGEAATLKKGATLDESGTLPVTVAGASYAVNVVQLKQMAADKDGENARETMAEFIVEAVGGVPENGDSLTFGGLSYGVVSVSAVAPAGVALIYKVEARGA